MTQVKHCQIAIIGAGIAGCIAALALSRHFQVLLIDKQSACPDKVGECLPPAAARILRNLNLLKEFEQRQDLHIPNYGIQSRWGSEQSLINDNLSNPDGLGWQLNRAGFENWLREQVVAQGIETLWPARLLDAQPGSDGWLLYLATHESGRAQDNQQSIAVPCHFVIDATGRHSAFATKLGLKRKVLDKQIALWASMACHEAHQLARIETSPDGWWYSAKLPEQRRVLALQTDSDLLEKGLQHDLALFCRHARTQPGLQSLLPQGIEQSGTIQLHGVVSANSTCLTQAAGHRWAALGDAACSFDPLSSQGMFNAMATAMQLANSLDEFGLSNADAAIEVTRLHQAQIKSVWQHYLSHRAHYYAQERRWPDSPYWQRRQIHKNAEFS
ncbi:dehydrogenase [Pseudoalteromonas rubra]|uniref:Dehydrogenase n=1 Tax=Pseudoalteromonas rubra TaxID=43658 RepID=A0A5S3WGB3_9GAMM|nr:tryptophan 7-halogenase [Pseudoalteromonas rubra]TMP25599.1 dehydrogenase [Pseudoalteromonas rubra]TMP30988.1 dehydrogenase [Pseudoalteromonas rubra]